MKLRVMLRVFSHEDGPDTFDFHFVDAETLEPVPSDLGFQELDMEGHPELASAIVSGPFEGTLPPLTDGDPIL